MIDVDVSKHSSTGLQQLIAKTSNMQYTTMDISKASAIHFQFVIGLISCLGSFLF